MCDTEFYHKQLWISKDNYSVQNILLSVIDITKSSLRDNRKNKMMLIILIWHKKQINSFIEKKKPEHYKVKLNMMRLSFFVQNEISYIATFSTIFCD